jgi:hypothetical protein
MGFGSLTLKLFQTFLYGLEFCCAAIILGFYSYFLAVQSSRHVSIPQWEKAVEGMSGIGLLYAVFGVILTCCLGGVAFFAFLGIVLDLLLCAAFVAIAVLTRSGASSCTGNNVTSPLGTGPADSKGGFGSGKGQTVTYAVSIGTACRYNTACFAVAIIAAFLFLTSAFMQFWIGRHHQHEKRYGPGPSNNYTSGSGTRWFGRRGRGPRTTHAAYAKDAEATGGLAAADPDIRPSHETGYTGTTAGTGTYTGNKYETTPTIPTASGYHTGPMGTSVNPYGYENTRTAATNY